MRIAVVTSGILPVPAVEGGAVENLTDYYLAENERLGHHEVTVFSVRPKQLPTVPSLCHTRYRFVDVTSYLSRVLRVLYSKVHKGDFYHPYVEYFLFRIKRALKRGQFDVVVLENRPGFALPLRKIVKGKLLIHLHTDTLYSGAPQANEILKACDGVISISDYIRQRVQSIAASLPVKTVYNGIDLSHYYTSNAIERRDLELGSDDFVLVYLGRVVPEKGVSEIVEAVARMVPRYPNLRLLVVGSSFYGADRRSDPYIESVRKLAEPIRDRITFTGYVPYERIPGILKACDVAVLPSIVEEAFGLTVLESMACGLPVVSTTAGGIPEVASGAAILLERGDGLSKRIEASIEKLINDEGEYQRLSALGLDRSRKFSLEAYKEGMMQAFVELSGN